VGAKAEFHAWTHGKAGEKRKTRGKKSSQKRKISGENKLKRRTSWSGRGKHWENLGGEKPKHLTGH